MTLSFPFTLQPGQTVTATIAFNPTATGVRTGVLSVVSNAPDSPATANITGTGTAISPAITSYLATSGGNMVDAVSGDVVVLKSSAWYGMESDLIPQMMGPTGNPGQLPRGYKTITYTGPTELGLVSGTVYEGVLDEMKRLGFNSFRLPVCEDITWAGALVNGVYTPSGGNDICGFLNPDLIDNTLPPDYAQANFIPAIEILDKIIDYGGSIGLRCIVDMHSLAPEDGGDPASETNGLWYTTAAPGDTGTGVTNGTIGSPHDTRSEAQWLAALTFIANRYKDATVITHFQAMSGIDLVNEPFAGTWDNNSLTGWPAAAERAATAIQAVNPNILIVVEGLFGPIAAAGGQFSGYSGDFTGVATRPVVTPIPNRLVYSPHEYIDLTQPRFSDPSFPATLVPYWNTVWGYIPQAAGQAYQAPIWIGEFSADFRDPATLTGDAVADAVASRGWINTLSTYLPTNGMSWDYWAMNGGATYTSDETDVLEAILGFDNATPNPDTMTALATLLAA